MDEESGRKPPATSRLALLLQDPDLLNMNFDYQSVREVFLEITSHIDSITRSIAFFEQAEAKFVKLTDLDNLNANMDSVNKQMERQSDDFATEVRDLRAYFGFQIGEIRKKVDHGLSTMISEMSKPPSLVASPQGDNGEIPVQAFTDPLLRDDVDRLKERFETLMAALSEPEAADDPADEGDDGQPEEQDTSADPAVVSDPVAPIEDAAPTGDGPKPVTPVKEAPLSKKQVAQRKMQEIRLNDMKVQIDGLMKKFVPYDERLFPLIPVVESAKGSMEAMHQEVTRMKVETALMKDELARLTEGQASSVLDIMKEVEQKAPHGSGPGSGGGGGSVDIEKPMTAMRHQFMQQFAKMENAFNEQIKKLKVEVSSLKNQLKNDDTPVSVPEEEETVSLVKEFAGEEPAEVKLLDEMRQQIEQERQMRQEAEAAAAAATAAAAAAAAAPPPEQEKPQHEEEKNEPEQQETVIVKEYATAEVQTVADGGSLLTVDNITGTTFPNNIVIAVLYDEPPRETTDMAIEVCRTPSPMKTPPGEPVAEAPAPAQRTPSPIASPKPAPIRSPSPSPSPVAEVKVEFVESQEAPVVESPEEVVVDEDIERPETPVSAEQPVPSNETLSLAPTTIFEYSHIAEPMTDASIDLDALKDELRRHEVLIEGLNDRVGSGTSNAQPSPPEALDLSIAGLASLDDVKRVSEQVDKNATAITHLRKQVGGMCDGYETLREEVQTRSAAPPPQAVLSRTVEDGQIVNRQIILTPVLFTPLYISDPNVSTIRPPSVTHSKPDRRNFSGRRAASPRQEAPKPLRKKEKKEKKPKVKKIEDDGSQPPEAPQREHLETPSKTETTPAVRDRSVEPEDPVVDEPPPKPRKRRESRPSAKPSVPKVKKPAKVEENKHEEEKHEEEKGEVADVPKDEPEPASDPIGDEIPPSPKSPAHAKDESEEPNVEDDDNDDDDDEVQEEEDEEEEEIEDSEDESEGYSEAQQGEDLTAIFNPKFTEIGDKIEGHRDQLRILREAVVEMRTQMHVMKAYLKDNTDMAKLPQVSIEDELMRVGAREGGGTSDSAVRTLRRRLDAQSADFEKEILEIRKEIIDIRQIQSKVPTVIKSERVVEVHVPQAPKFAPGQQQTSSVVRDVESNDSSKGDTLRHIPLPDESPRLVTVTPLEVPTIASDIKRERTVMVEQSPSQSGPLMKDNRRQIPHEVTPVQRGRIPQREDQPPTSPKMEGDPNYRTVFNNVIPQQIEELRVLSANDEVEARVLQLIVDIRTQLQLQVDHNTTRLTNIDARIDSFVTKEYVQKFFQKMHASMTEINSSVAIMKQAMPDRVTKEELQDVAEDLVRSLTAGQETSGGTTSYKCLLCGRSKTSISGMIKDRKVVQALGEAPEATAGGGGGSPAGSGARGTLIYGPDKQLYRGRGNLGRPTTAAAGDGGRTNLPVLEKK